MYKILEITYFPGGVDENGELHNSDHTYNYVATDIQTREQAEEIYKSYESYNKDKYRVYDIMTQEDEDDLPF